MGLKDFLFNNDYSFLLQIAIILLSTKLLGLLTKRISLPQVVGALAAGIILGPMLLDVVERNDLIVSLAELGVIVLMFSAGLETDIQELKKAGLASFVIALRWWADFSSPTSTTRNRIRKWLPCSGRTFSSALS